tara:strand:- start:2905 stop:3108 length:204 start_codon:yes stop_codon:yes gene_type:complete
MILTVTCLATNIPLDIELDLVEQAWATDNNPKTINESWYKLCESVNQRLGIDMQGFELETLGGRPIH